MNKTRFLFLLYFLLAGVYAGAQTSYIKGTVTDVKKLPIEYANVVLYDAADTTRMVKAVTTDVKGRFALTKIPHGSYRLQASCVGYVTTCVRIGNLQEDIKELPMVMAELTVALGEATVTAQRVVMEFDRQIIYPGKLEKETAVDGVELVDKLHLDGVTVNKAVGSIGSVLGGDVNLRINGGPASLDDLKQIDPKMVRRVEYHDMPSMRYGKVDAVIDLYVKRQEFGGSGRISASQYVTSPQGNGAVDLKLYHAKSEFSFWGSGNYARYKVDMKRFVTYNFEDGSALTRNEDTHTIGRSRDDSYSGGIGYSYLNPDDVLFTAKFSYSGSPREAMNGGNIRMGGQSDTKLQDEENRMRRNSRLGLYFQKNLKKKQFVAFEVAGSYLHTNSYYTYNEQQEGVTLTNILSDVNGDTYSLVAEGIYEKRFKTDKLSVGLNHRLSYADNDYEGTTVYKNRFNTYKTYGYAEWMGGAKKLNYSLAVRGTLNRIVQRGEKSQDKYVWMTYRLGYRFSDKLQLRYVGETCPYIPSLSALNKVDQAINAYQIRRGNPDLRKTTPFTNTLIFNHRCTDNFSYVLNVNDVYTVHPQLATTFRENGKFITQYQNGKNYHHLNIMGSASWFLFNRQLRLFGRLGYKTARERGYSFSNSYSTWYGEGMGEWTCCKKVTFLVGAGKGAKSSDYGNLYYSGWKIQTGVGCNWKHWSFVGLANFSLGDPYTSRERSMNPYVVKEQRFYNLNLKNYVSFRIVRNFKFGRQRKSANQRIENGGGESAVF